MWLALPSTDRRGTAAHVSVSSSVTTQSLTRHASPIFVHHTEGKWKARSNLFKLLLRDISILVEIIVLKDRLGKNIKNFFHLLKRNQPSLPSVKMTRGQIHKSLATASVTTAPRHSLCCGTGTPGHIPGLCCPRHYRVPRCSKPANINCASHWLLHIATALCGGWVSSPPFCPPYRAPLPSLAHSLA